MHFKRIEHLLRLGIKFVLVFDRTPPEIKSGQPGGTKGCCKCKAKGSIRVGERKPKMSLQSF